MMFVQADTKLANPKFSTRIWIVLAVIVVVTFVSTLALYGHTHNLIKTRLYDRLGSLAQTTALQLQHQQIESDALMNNVELERYLHSVANVSAMVSRVYVLQAQPSGYIEYVGSSSDANTATFNGSKATSQFTESQLALLRSYVVSTFSLLEPADTTITAYAPVLTADGKRITVALEVSRVEYYGYTHAVLYPFVLFVFCLLSIIALLTWLLMRTNKEQLRTMEETDRQKDELLSIVSHQLATPVSSMQYILELLQDGDYGRVTKKQAEQITKLQSLVHSASDLVRMILDVSRIQMGKMTVHPTEFNLEHFIDGIIDMVQPKVTEKSLKFVTTITRPMPTVQADERLLRMTILNVLSNAIKYTANKGTIWFEASVTKDYFYCKVTDTGVGIPQEEQSQLYQKLYRASNVRDDLNGTGFGLYVAKGAIEAQGGTIQFHSKVGKGTTFYVELPLKN